MEELGILSPSLSDVSIAPTILGDFTPCLGGNINLYWSWREWHDPHAEQIDKSIKRSSPFFVAMPHRLSEGEGGGREPAHVLIHSAPNPAHCPFPLQR